MIELLEILKVTGPAIAILIWLTTKLWHRLNKKEDKIEELFNRLLEETKRTTLTYIQLFQIKSKTKDNIALDSYLDFLNQKADELKTEINQLKFKK
uniref:Uncharacterized protein n=1 Tax=candidate division WOR-3 bacterium TaxID=2052148 RepID=A0A7C6A8Q8_UNCW3